MVAGQRRQKDVQARWTKKHGKSYFGYKLSSSVDRRHKLIRRMQVSAASEHDTLHFEGVLDAGNTSRDVWADKGYVDGEREQRLTAKGWHMHIQRKGQAGEPLSDCQEQRNQRIAKTRARVEHVFASLEQMGGKAQRSIGLARATLLLNWKAAAYNLRRLGTSNLAHGGRPSAILTPEVGLDRSKTTDSRRSRAKKRPPTHRGARKRARSRRHHSKVRSNGCNSRCPAVVLRVCVL